MPQIIKKRHLNHRAGLLSVPALAQSQVVANQSTRTCIVERFFIAGSLRGQLYTEQSPSKSCSCINL